MSYTTHYSIITGVRHQKDDAWERFYREYASLIRLHGMDCGVPEYELDDLVQNVMLKFFDESPYAAKNGVAGESALLEHFRHRQALELRLCHELLPGRYTVLKSKGYGEFEL